RAERAAVGRRRGGLRRTRRRAREPLAASRSLLREKRDGVAVRYAGRAARDLRCLRRRLRPRCPRGDAPRLHRPRPALHPWARRRRADLDVVILDPAGVDRRRLVLTPAAACDGDHRRRARRLLGSPAMRPLALLALVACATVPPPPPAPLPPTV